MRLMIRVKRVADVGNTLYCDPTVAERAPRTAKHRGGYHCSLIYFDWIRISVYAYCSLSAMTASDNLHVFSLS